jgi:NitT/TauT family transport system substrate-binding protein
MTDVRIAVPDLVSSSYFPALAATRMDTCDDGFRLTLQHIFPAKAAAEALRDGAVQFTAGPVHAAAVVFRGWRGAKVLMALSQGTYWMLVVNHASPVRRNQPDDLRDLTVAVAPGPDLALRQLLRDWRIDPTQRGIRLVPPPGEAEAGESFGVRAARALSTGTIDAFWANSMAAEIAVSTGVGRIVLDPRRGDGPAAAATYTFPALVTSDDMIDRRPDEVRATVRAVMRAQAALKRDPQLAAGLADGLFPRQEAGLISELVRRDGPFYDPGVNEAVVAGLDRFSRAVGLLDAPVSRADIVYPDSPALSAPPDHGPRSLSVS